MADPRRAGLLAACAAAFAIAASPASAQLPLTEPAPERARVVFTANGTLFSVAADGSGRTEIVKDAVEPAWSPDRTRIAFSRYESDDESEWSRIWTVAPDGGDLRPVTPKRKGFLDWSPTWSPDGGRIAFARFSFDGRDLVTTIMTASAAGGDLRRVVRADGEDERLFTHLAWSPDGGRLLATFSDFIGEEDPESRSQLEVVQVADGRRTRLLRNARDATWSPDGARIAYAGRRPGCEADRCWELYVANADGGGRRRLTTDETDDGSPSWSADGSRIAFSSHRNYPYGEQPEIYSVQPDGGCLTWLTNGTRQSRDPSWEPGAALSTDPGGCGAVPREPLIETDTGEVAAYKRTPVWWLGPRFGNLLLTGASVEPGVAFLHYGDCAAFEPSECPPGFDLDSLPVCRSHVLAFVNPRTLARHEGALVAMPAFPEEDHPTIYTGTSIVAFDGIGTEAIAPGVLDGLRRFGEDAPPAGGLPRAEIPLRFWRTLEQTRARVRKYGSVAAVQRRFRISRRTIVSRLAIDRRLRKLGPFGRHDCRRG